MNKDLKKENLGVVIVCRRADNLPLGEGSIIASCRMCEISVQVSKEAQKAQKDTAESVILCNSCGMKAAKALEHNPRFLGIGVTKETGERLDSGEQGEIIDWLRTKVNRA